MMEKLIVDDKKEISIIKFKDISKTLRMPI